MSRLSLAVESKNDGYALPTRHVI